MNQRTKRDSRLIDLISQFESLPQSGHLDGVDVKEYGSLVSHYLSEHMYELALQVNELAIRTFPFRSDFYISKSKILLELGMYDQCIKYLDRAEQKAPYDIDITLLRARVIAVLGNADEALDMLDNLKDIVGRPQLMSIYLVEAYIYEILGDCTMVVERLRTVLRDNPLHEEALQLLWNTLDTFRAYELSIEINESLIDLNPYNYMAWYMLGQSYAAESEYDQAIDALEYSFIINSDYATGYLECAELCMDMCRYGQALSIYKEYTLKFGASEDILINMAKCQLELKDHMGAKLNLFKAVKMEKANDTIYFLLGECYSRDGNWYKAIAAYLKATDIDDTIEEYYFGLAKAFDAVEDYNKATVNFQIAADLAPHRNEIWSEYTSFLIKLGLYDEADQILQEGFCFAYGGDMLYCQAIVAFYMNEQKKGLSLLEEALEEDFESHKLIFRLSPELEINKEIMAMIRYFHGEFAYQEVYT